MQNCSSISAPLVKGCTFTLDQCPKNAIEEEEMRNVLYASLIGSLLYALVCTRPDLTFLVGMLSRYQSNHGKDHWKAAKKVLRHLQGIKEYTLTYRHTDLLKVVGYSDSNYKGCKDTGKSTSGYNFLLAEGGIS
nr:retrovirus-related Pol polyprotein from transposon TNT 1-94 [Tanacetum cinerariifolium]